MDRVEYSGGYISRLDDGLDVSCEEGEERSKDYKVQAM